MTVTPDIFRPTLQKYVGCHYGFCDRCGGGCHPCQYDCSGLQCKGTNETGLTGNVCTSSFVLAQQCYDLGLLVAWEEADNYDGLWWIRGDDLGRRDNGSKANGASGHIVYRVRHVDPGTGVVTFYTIEAMGRRYGCVNGSTNGREWDAAYKIPGMDYAPPKPKVSPMMSEQLNARLYNPELDGWFEGYADGRVDYLAPDGHVTHGGMVTDKDRRDFAGRTLATLEARWVVRGGVHTFAYTIRATSNETYIPERAPR